MIVRFVLASVLITGRVFAADTSTPNLGPAKSEIGSAGRDDKVNSNYDKIDAAVGSLVNVKAHGAVGDGTTDDTEAIQAALNLFTNGLTATASGALYFPHGDYKITSSLIYGGGVSHGLRMFGAIGGSRGPTGARISWHGAAGGTMMILNGANGVTMENLEFNGRSLAKYGVHSTATNTIKTTLGSDVTPGVRTVTPGAMANIAVGTLLNVDSEAGVEYVYVTATAQTTFTASFTKSHRALAVVGNGPPSSGNVFRRLTIGGVVGTGSAALAFGNTTSFATAQISEVDMYDLQLHGDSSTSGAGIVILSSGNTKNFKLNGGSIAHFKCGVDWTNASGTFLINGTIFGGQTIADVRTGTGNMHIQSVESEGSGYSFVTGGTGANPGSLTIVGSSWQGATGADDIMIAYSGNITLIGNTFFNWRTASSVPKIKTAAFFDADQPATLFSQGNWYMNAATGFAPILGSGNTSVWTLAHDKLSVTSLGDYGGTGGALVRLRNFVPVANIAYFEGRVIADPPAPEANAGQVYFRDNGSGKTQLVVRFPNGAIQVIATEP